MLEACAAPREVLHPWQVRLGAGVTELDGFVQVPRGGAPGSTSPERPELEELGIESSSLYEARISYERQRARLYAAARVLAPSESTTLERDLTSNGETFPAGTEIDSDIMLGAYRAGIQWRVRSPWRALELWPALELYLMNLTYDIEAESLTGQADRSMTRANGRVGLEAEWSPASRIVLDAGLFVSLPLAESPRLTSFEAGVSYRLVEAPGWFAALRLGLGFEHLEFDDHQSVPNRFEIDLGPTATAGIILGF